MQSFSGVLLPEKSANELIRLFLESLGKHLKSGLVPGRRAAATSQRSARQSRPLPRNRKELEQKK